MSQIAIKGATTGTGVFTLESPATNTDRTLVLPDEAGTVLTSATPVVAQKGVPAFFVYLSSTQSSITNNVPTKIQLNTKSFDTHNFFDTTNFQFNPTIAGYYLLSWSIVNPDASASSYIQGDLVGTITTKSGAASTGISGVMYPRSSGSVIIYFNGSNDLMSLYTYGGTSSGSYSVLGGPAQAWLSGCLVRAA